MRQRKHRKRITMSNVISTQVYKNYQIVIEEYKPELFSYEINDQILIKTVGCMKGFSADTLALSSAQAKVDGYPVTQATDIITTVLLGDSATANTIILAILNGGLTVVSTATPDEDFHNNPWGNNREEHDE